MGGERSGPQKKRGRPGHKTDIPLVLDKSGRKRVHAKVVQEAAATEPRLAFEKKFKKSSWGEFSIRGEARCGDAPSGGLLAGKGLNARGGGENL